MTGTGTQADPYAVSTWDEIVAVLPQEGKYAVLTSDIDMLNVDITDGSIIIACNFDGQGHRIKNAYLSHTLVPNDILFKMQYAVTFQNLKLENWYSDGVWIFNGDSAHPSYYQMPTFHNVFFNGELVNSAHFLVGDYHNQFPIFKHCDIFIMNHGYNPFAITGSRLPQYEDCNIHIYGDATGVFKGKLDDSFLSGEITLNNTDTSALLNVGVSDGYQGVIDLVVHADTAWNATFASAKLLVNTDHMENVTATGTYIACTDAQMIDSTYLSQQGFMLGDTPTNFSWSSWLSSVTKASYWDAQGDEININYSTVNNEFSLALTDLPDGRRTHTDPYLNYQYGVYSFSASDYKKYRCVVEHELPDGVTPNITFFRNGNGDTWSLNGNSDDFVITAPYSTSSFTLTVGVRNDTGNALSGTAVLNNVSVYEHSAWAIENGKLINNDIPQIHLLGAFCNCKDMSVVSIPRSVKKIGRFSFKNTALTSVMIASDCEYFPTSFPDGCTINFYPD